MRIICNADHFLVLQQRMKLVALSLSSIGLSVAFAPLPRPHMRSRSSLLAPHIARGKQETCLSVGAGCQGFISKLRGGADVVAESIHSGSPSTFFVGSMSSIAKTMKTRAGGSMGLVQEAFCPADLIPILAWSFLPQIILRFVHNQIVNKTIRRKEPLDFEKTPYLKPLSSILCQLGQVGLGVYLGELALVFLSGLGVPYVMDKPRLLASCLYGFWAARWITVAKKGILNKAIRRRYRNASNLSSQKEVYTRITDAIVYLITTLFILDGNNIDVGSAFASILTLCGASSVIVGLALKEPATDIVQGTSILITDKFSTGDTIKLSDGTQGRVEELRWTDTKLRAPDATIVRIPHSHMAKNRIINFSRLDVSSVSQKLTLPNKGTQKISTLLDDISKEIRQHCPKLITNDDKKPFDVFWTDIDGDNSRVN